MLLGVIWARAFVQVGTGSGWRRACEGVWDVGWGGGGVGSVDGVRWEGLFRGVVWCGGVEVVQREMRRYLWVRLLEGEVECLPTAATAARNSIKLSSSLARWSNASSSSLHHSFSSLPRLPYNSSCLTLFGFPSILSSASSISPMCPRNVPSISSRRASCSSRLRSMRVRRW